jgi:hypothetical protein
LPSGAARSRCRQLADAVEVDAAGRDWPALTHEFVGKLSLGINPDEQPRWG